MPDDDLTLAKLEEAYDSLPKPPRFYCGPDTDVRLLPFIEERRQALQAMHSLFCYCALTTLIELHPYLPKNWLMIDNPERGERCFFNLETMEGWSMPDDWSQGWSGPGWNAPPWGTR